MVECTILLRTKIKTQTGGNRNGSVEISSHMPNDDHSMEDDVHLLKSIVINVENLDIIKQMLNKTREYRAQMLLKKETEIKEHFPYFFSHPLELVRLFPFNHFVKLILI